MCGAATEQNIPYTEYHSIREMNFPPFAVRVDRFVRPRRCHPRLPGAHPVAGGGQADPGWAHLVRNGACRWPDAPVRAIREQGATGRRSVAAVPRGRRGGEWRQAGAAGSRRGHPSPDRSAHALLPAGGLSPGGMAALPLEAWQRSPKRTCWQSGADVSCHQGAWEIRRASGTRTRLAFRVPGIRPGHWGARRGRALSRRPGRAHGLRGAGQRRSGGRGWPGCQVARGSLKVPRGACRGCRLTDAITGTPAAVREAPGHRRRADQIRRTMR